MKLDTKSKWALALATLAMGLASPSKSQPADPGTAYVGPHQLVDIGGRKLNLVCMGEGPRTVIFDAGGSDWSVIWALVQPEVAKRTRACSYDRAGLGYSDPAKGPRSPMAVVDDLHALVHAAGLKTPLVLVGHSLGGFNMKLYVALYPEDVAGLVLVDPSEERSYERTAAALAPAFGDAVPARSELEGRDFLKTLIAKYWECAAAAKAHDLDPASQFYKGCTDPVREPLGPAIAAERARIQVTAAYQEAQASEVANSVYGDSGGDAVYARLFRPGRFGNKPLIVLSHGIYDKADPIDAADYRGWTTLHRQTAALSLRGVQRVVPDTHHNIEVEKPEVIVAAIGEVLDQLGKAK